MNDKKPLKNPKGGLTAAGRKAFGGNLKPGVKNYSKASTSDKKRWISWALRFYGQDNYPPLKDDKGLPTRFALTAAAWGEPVPKTEAEARAIAAKARKRKQELANQNLYQSSFQNNNEINENVEAFLYHAGVKGMKWGVRKQSKTGPSRRTTREAKKDAQEFARAQMFYGQGAGTRRKLIKATVDAKSKKDPNYKKAFDSSLKSQDMSTHAGKARKERKSADRREKNSKRLGAVARRATGEMGTQAAFVAIAATGIAFVRSPKGQAMLNQSINFASKNLSKIR